jgi:OmcA/MtrC family decaheme c-type cytochrome
MRLKLAAFFAIVTIGAFSLPAFSAPASTSRQHGAKPAAPSTPQAKQFAADQKEAYLSDDGIAYIRPGLKLTILSVTNVAPGSKPVVEFTLTDSFDQPLDRLGKVTPGPITPAFVLGQWNPDTRYFHSLTTRTRNGTTTPWLDLGGTFTDLEMGHYKYTFATAMPANLDVTKTLTLGAQAKRTLLDIIGKDYFADNVFKDFRPDGGAPLPTWGAMALANSCNKCHDPLAVHGKNRRDPHLCVMCHNNENTDPATGYTFSAKVFFHKIHMGENLPSVKGGKPFVQAGDWSTVAFPQDIRNCTTCHDPKAAESAIWYTRPNREACGSCHDDVNFATGANHPAGAQADDTACASCHQPSGDEFDASIQGAHTNPLKSKQLKGITATIASVSNLAAGKKPTVVFSIKNTDGSAIDGTKLTTFSPILAGPTKSYTTYYRENAKTAGVFDAAAGTTTYTFTAMVPADATGTWTISADIYRNVNLKRADGKADIAVREAAFNPIQYTAVTGDLTPRRTSVAIANCNVCHETLALHGGQRRNTQECVICHNPTNTDVAQRPASEGPPESISFQRHIHRIHSGENLTQEWTVYGFGGSKHNYNELRFPGDRRNCAKCHVAGAFTLPLKTGIDSVPTLRDYFTPQGPATAACLGCHDNPDAAAHAYLNSTMFGGTKLTEACATCHGVDKDWDVAKVHAR